MHVAKQGAVGKKKGEAIMKRLQILITIISMCNINNAHIISNSTQDYYTIQNIPSSTGSSIYNLGQGIVKYTSSTGTIKLYTHVHMARKAPANATQIFGTITIGANNKLAGTWYLYK